MTLALTGLVSLALMAATVLIHYEALRLTGRRLPHLTIRPRQRVLVAITACMVAHVIEIALYAAALAGLHALPAFGSIGGAFRPGSLDFLYFSATNYTTLGVGDIYPRGALRIVAGVESLNGFLMITWSASFTYLAMQRYWHPGEDR